MHRTGGRATENKFKIDQLPGSLVPCIRSVPAARLSHSLGLVAMLRIINAADDKHNDNVYVRLQDATVRVTRAYTEKKRISCKRVKRYDELTNFVLSAIQTRFSDNRS